MSGPNIEEANTSSTGEKTHSLDRIERGDVNSAAFSLSTPVTSEEVARQIRAATDPLTRQLQKLCNIVLDLRSHSVMKKPLLQSKGLLSNVAERFDTNFFA